MDNNNNNNSDDPFASIAELCCISSSQEELLKRCRFAGEPEPDDNESLSDESDDDIPVESTGIVMVSPPESPEDGENQNYCNFSRDNDVFHTPPEVATSQENHQQTVAAVDNQGDQTVVGDDDDNSRVVDLGRHTDLGFSMEEELTQRIDVDSGMISHESEDFSVLKRKLDSDNGKNVDQNLGLVTPEAALNTLERAVKSIEKLKSSSSKKVKPCDQNSELEASRDGLDIEAENLSRNSCLNSLQNHQIEGVNNGDSSVKRKLEFCTHEVENEARIEEVNDGDSSPKRKLKFCTREVENEGIIEGGPEEIENDEVNGFCHDNERCLDARFAEKQKKREAKRSIDDIDKFRYIRPTSVTSLEKKKDIRAKRALPMSMCVNNGYAEPEIAPDDVRVVTLTLLDVLKMLSDDYTCDPDLENLSVLEVAKRCGMTFP